MWLSWREIGNECLKGSLSVTNIAGKMRENRLREEIVII